MSIIDAALSAPPAFFDVLAERRRQIETKGWTPVHDDTHVAGQIVFDPVWGAVARLNGAYQMEPPDRQNLVKAAALILAEIERIDRAASTTAASTAPVPKRLPTQRKIP